MKDYRSAPLWVQAFGPRSDKYDEQRGFLANALHEFRERVSVLVAQIQKDMPALTIHDVTHIDALWWTASEIAGPEYELNAAEAFLLGGAFLLHDSAHCIAAYPGGITEIVNLPQWKSSCIKHGVKSEDVVRGTEKFQNILFDVLRVLHPTQARVLARQSWKAPDNHEPMYLLPNEDLRRAYGEAIGVIAESHWLYPHQLEKFNQFKITPPACIHPAPWGVDVLKVAVILRTADAAHIDSERAPRFLQALLSPQGISKLHWDFQSRINKPTRDPDENRKELCISGASFPVDEQESWWLAYDTARMIDGELKAADRLLMDSHRPRLAVNAVAHAHTPEDFSKVVPVEGWHPIDASIKITDIHETVRRFGGEKLYGKDLSAALRELLQNSVDAIRACRKLGGLGEEEGEIEVAHELKSEGDWLHITDTGLGMSRYVLTDVLLDFGKSLWRSSDLDGEWNNLLATGFQATGQYGIGFFSIFMLGGHIKIVTRRYESKDNERSQWVLEFTNGANQRPILRPPLDSECLKRPGTRISVLLEGEAYCKLRETGQVAENGNVTLSLSEVCGKLVPALDINLFVKEQGSERTKVVRANDWLELDSYLLARRISPAYFKNPKVIKYGKSGPWSNMTILRDSSDNILGRFALYDNDRYLSDPSVGIGAINGIRAGIVHGIMGVVMSQQQEDLARNSATPIMNTSDLQRWAQEQAHKLYDSKAITISSSSLLSYFGASADKLMLGKLKGSAIYYADLAEFLKDSDILIIHDGTIEHDDDDDIVYRDFYTHLEYMDNVLEIEDHSSFAWPDELVQCGPSREVCSIMACAHELVNLVWGEGYNVEVYEAKVAEVISVSIFRECTVYRRN
ncbi:ATP-binding protein [Pseudomonas edaphica]|uniref:ATP-binding protein n=1 Tax=Pseudomonas edaphica TaxID=2006980 RepID=A0A7Y8E729_9PSED|nr:MULTISPECIES: ATP-binding protein [Pseudomonas]NWC44722.1 ATP-binding protein [Pseudomonas sp. IPO3747]NWE09268.1 ATP-binding protein [Pseudomonas edaphica]NWE81320.1 ATP-binding protein [Pseudomonas edaphica]